MVNPHPRNPRESGATIASIGPVINGPTGRTAALWGAHYKAGDSDDGRRHARQKKWDKRRGACARVHGGLGAGVQYRLVEGRSIRQTGCRARPVTRAILSRGVHRLCFGFGIARHNARLRSRTMIHQKNTSATRPRGHQRSAPLWPGPQATGFDVERLGPAACRQTLALCCCHGMNSPDPHNQIGVAALFASGSRQKNFVRCLGALQIGASPSAGIRQLVPR
jgi:hypothetical protein